VDYFQSNIISNFLAKIFFEKYEVSTIYFLFSNSLPLYLTGLYTGIVINVGYYDSTIAPFYEGVPQLNAFTHCFTGGFRINKTLHEDLCELNAEETVNKDIISFKVLEDLKFKVCKILSRK